jgi:predicted TIM-barrel fold metal-dependent hydrolase
MSDLLPLASRPDVAVKANAMPAQLTGAFPFRDLYRPPQDVVEAFGPDRVVWGSDLARLPGSLFAAVRMSTEEVDFLSGVALEKVMDEAIIDWIGW